MLIEWAKGTSWSKFFLFILFFLWIVLAEWGLKDQRALLLKPIGQNLMINVLDFRLSGAIYWKFIKTVNKNISDSLAITFLILIRF